MKRMLMYILKYLKLFGILIVINFGVAAIICGLIIKDFTLFYDLLFYISIVYFLIGGMNIIGSEKLYSYKDSDRNTSMDEILKKRDSSICFALKMTSIGLLTIIISQIIQ